MQSTESISTIFRVLGHFEKPIFLELCRYIESRNVPIGCYLFQIGDPDDAIHVVQSGRVLVHITEPVSLCDGGSIGSFNGICS